MITAIATFRLPRRLTVDEARAIFEGTAPRYQSQPGLIRKYYVLSEDGMTAGGVYLWQSRQDADALYDDAWRAFVTEKYGAPPRPATATTRTRASGPRRSGACRSGRSGPAIAVTGRSRTRARRTPGRGRGEESPGRRSTHAAWRAA